MQRVGVVGGGLMGSGIAEVAARASLDVRLVERDEASAERARSRIAASLGKAVKSGRLTEQVAEESLQRITFSTSFDVLSDRQIVIEAVPEDEALKYEVFDRIDQVVSGSDVVLATNTSSIPIMKLAMATKHPEQVIGVHFFNPVPVLALVEIVPSLLTSTATQERTKRFAEDQLGRTVIDSQDRAGFVVNALLIPYLLSAIRMLESGFATAEDIDTGMVEGCAHPMGPLRLTDLIGLDTTAAVADSLYEEFKEPLYAPPPLLQRMVAAGLLGRKTGRGFYDYSEEKKA